MDAFASIDVLDFNNSAGPRAYRVDGVYAEPAIANEPRDHLLSHSILQSKPTRWRPNARGNTRAVEIS
jgi:hypothetical protein